MRACGLELPAVLRLCPPPKRDVGWAVVWAEECVWQDLVSFIRGWLPPRRVRGASSMMTKRDRVPIGW